MDRCPVRQYRQAIVRSHLLHRRPLLRVGTRRHRLTLERVAHEHERFTDVLHGEWRRGHGWCIDTGSRNGSLVSDPVLVFRVSPRRIDAGVLPYRPVHGASVPNTSGVGQRVSSLVGRPAQRRVLTGTLPVKMCSEHIYRTPCEMQCTEHVYAVWDR